MKFRFISLGILVNCITIANAQLVDIEDSLTVSPMEQFTMLTSDLDLSAVTTGLMADQSLPFVNYTTYDGSALTDKNKASGFEFAKMYATLSGMVIDITKQLPAPTAYTTVAATALPHQVFMGAMHYNYHQFKPHALDSNLLTFDGALFHNVPAADTPYEQKEVFLVAPLKQKSTKLTNHFSWRSDLLFSNTGKTLDSIQVDFGNSSGLRTINIDSTYIAQYTSEGLKTITSVFYYADSTDYTAHAQLMIDQNLDLTPSDYETDILPPFTINAVTSFGGEYGSATITTLLACGHKNLQKPLIWVEGFNPKALTDFNSDYNLDPAYMITILEDNLIEDKNLLKYCEEEGYDLVYVDFEDGGDWIQKNAYTVQEVIRWANAEKAANGSTEQNVVIGESMGGIIAKYALSKMETASEDHDVSVYMSLDSPHLGANIPIAAQYAARHIPNINIAYIPLWQYFDLAGQPDIRLGEQMLDSRAAKQMLIYYAPSDFSNQTGTSLTSVEHITFYAEYAALPDLTECETLMSSNGSPYGGDGEQEFEPEQELIHIKFNNTFLHNLWLDDISGEINSTGDAFAEGFKATGVGLVWAIGSLITQGFVDFRVNALPNYTAVKKVVYKGHLSIHILGIPLASLLFTHKKVKVKEVYPYDSAPGGFYEIPADIGTLFDGDTPEAFDFAVESGNISITANTFNFIPAFSALDLPASYKTNPYAVLTNQNLVNSLSSAKRTVISNDTYPWRNFFQEDITLDNSLHINFYQNNAEWFLFHLVGNNKVNEAIVWSTGSFNFGEGQFGPTDNFLNTDHRRTTSKIDVLSRITGTGQVYVNKSNRIGHITVDGGSYTVLGTSSNPTHFVVSVKPLCGASSKNLLVDEGGLLYVGEGEYQTGDLHLLKGTTLTIGNNGSLYIRENSKVIVHEGAQLIVENGGKIVNYGEILLNGLPETMDLANNGVLRYEDGARIIMPRSAASIHFNGGDLHIAENTTFEIYTTGYTESGYLRFSKGGRSIYGEPSSTMFLKGVNRDDVMIRVESDAKFWANDQLNFITLRTAKTEIVNGGAFISHGKFDARECEFVGFDDNEGLTFFRFTNFVDCNLDNITVYAPLFYENNGILRITNSTFNNNTGLYDVNVYGRGFHFDNVTFNSSSDQIVLSHDLTLTSKIINSTFNGNTADYFTSGLLDYSSAEIRVSNSDFNDTRVGVEKSYGQLSLRCNRFTDFKIAGAAGGNDARLEMTSGMNLGYNTFNKFSPGFGYNITMYNSQYLGLIDGSNKFDNAGSNPIIYGSIQLGEIGVTTTIPAPNNQWSLTSPGYVPVAADFTITSSSGGGPL